MLKDRCEVFKAINFKDPQEKIDSIFDNFYKEFSELCDEVIGKDSSNEIEMILKNGEISFEIK